MRSTTTKLRKSTLPNGLVVDASVIIDYWDSQRGLLSLIAENVGQLYIPSPVLAEECLDMEEFEVKAVGVALIEPAIEEILGASSAERPSSLSFFDELCHLIAANRRLGCLTNDRGLRSRCTSSGVPVMWGLQPMVELAGQGFLSMETAMSVAQTMRQRNSHITEAIVGRFREKLLLRERGA